METKVCFERLVREAPEEDYLIWENLRMKVTVKFSSKAKWKGLTRGL